MSRPSIPVITIRIDLGSTNLSSTYTEIVANLANGTDLTNMKMAEIIYDQSDILVLGEGNATAEKDMLHIAPSPGNGKIPLHLAPGAKLHLKTLTGTVTTGNFIINFYG